MLHVEHTNDLETLLAHPDHWNSLAQGVPFRETSWLHAWWRHFGNGHTPLVLIARDAQHNVVGLLPLYRTSRRALHSLGNGHACTDHVAPLAAAENAGGVGLAFGRYLAEIARHRTDGWETLELEGGVEGDPGMVALAGGLHEAGAALHTHARMNTWFRPCDESWNACLKGFSRRSQQKMRKLLKACDPDGPLTFRVAESPQEVDRALHATIELHQRRWNGAGEPGAFAEPTFRHFIVDALQDFQHRGQLQLLTLEHAGQPIAGLINLVGRDRRIYVYNSGYDPDHAELEPGIMLNLLLLRFAHEQGFVGIDYLRGDEPYKARLKAQPKRLLKLRAVAPAWMPKLRHAAWVTGFGVKQIVRRHRGRPLADVIDLTVPSTPPSVVPQT